MRQIHCVSKYTSVSIQSLQCLLRTRPLGCMNVSVYAYACDPACIRYRSVESSYEYRYINKCMLVFATPN